MSKLMGFLGVIIGGSVGWWLGSLVGLTTAIILSGFGSGFGLYMGRKFVKDYMGG